MRYFVLMALNSITLAGVALIPTPTDRISPQGVWFPINSTIIQRPVPTSLDQSKFVQFWGPEVSGRRFAIRESTQIYSYVKGGGLGEEIAANVTLFSSAPTLKESRSVWHFRVTVRSNGLPDYTRVFTAKSASFNSDSKGGCWAMPGRIVLRELRHHWGRIPSRISMEATLEETGLPRISSDVAEFLIVPIERRQASWHRRLESLSPRQSRQEIEILLGSPMATKTLSQNGKIRVSTLIYPDPTAAKTPHTTTPTFEIHLDPLERFRFYHYQRGC